MSHSQSQQTRRKKQKAKKTAARVIKQAQKLQPQSVKTVNAEAPKEQA